ncbi:TIGR00730 family Rossman fold protein [Companilactobacillus mishanensis]|uniref:Cytokinin riboside 5'-monophosphate phosphoribohydrolase n=1 Tax=Companilactobacillus mishanensis TaxID=2486008 RepID=A0A5P0ZF96_9LACO|nr:TIGR00730 family Rossman fold protein [Companilactobacillus mishanensis]MQS44203.1 TIGR00730 family Rossman fold protein [Companilactobacillus mishanensis]MQS51688.1 TIGR00730 family Rossman fold protein [Companilactobacillus mishanensis]MQS88501.1 TIGR00730 family Rossman fold protein [Companilactobacillus mishanensis]
MKNIAVYCGASTGNKDIYQKSAEDLGHWIVKNGYGLTYGGGKYGLMGVIADTVIDDGGYVHGIITKDLADRELTHERISKIDIVDNIDIRKEEMLADSFASIALPGGPGTLEEMSDAFSWTRIGENDNACAYFNVNHYYDSLEAMYNQMITEGFMDQSAKDTLLFSDSLAEIGHFIESYVVPERREYTNK